MYRTVRIVYIVFLLQLTCFNAFSQDDNKSQAVYLEVGGSGAIYSLNFDTRFSSKVNGLGGRIGFGITPLFLGGAVTTVPLVINYLKGEKKHFFEMGAGATYISVTGAIFGLVEYESAVIANLAIGYRRVSESGFTFRAGLTPLIGKVVETSGLLTPQVSLGYSF